jgi:hypothetical protein
MCGEPSVEKAELKIAVMDRDRVAVVRVIALADQFERRAGAQARDNVLTAFERDAGDLGVKARLVEYGSRRYSSPFAKRRSTKSPASSCTTATARIEGLSKSRSAASKAASERVGGGNALVRGVLFWLGFS